MSASPAGVGPKPLQLDGGARAVLLFHGLSSGPQELQFVGRGLHRAGFTVRLPVIDGYSFGTFGDRAAGAAQWQARALAEFDLLRERFDSVAVGGLCIGAVLALRVAELRGSQVEAALAMSTTLHYDGWATPWTRRLLPLAHGVPLAGRIKVRERDPYGVKDERMRAWIAAQMRAAGHSDAGAATLRVRDLLQARRLMACTRRELDRVSAPVLLLHARHDDAASPRSAFEVAERVSAARVRCVLFGDSYHMLSIDHEKHRVLAELCDFIGAPPHPGSARVLTLARSDFPRSIP